MSRVYSKTGVHTLRRKVHRGLDQRTVVARALRAWKAALVRDLGGEGNLSAAQSMLVESIVHARLYLERLDQFLIEQEQLVIGNRKAVLPALRQRQDIQDSLAKLLSQLQEGSSPKGRRSLMADLRRSKDLSART